MSIPGLPFPHTIAPARGASSAADIAVGGILSTSVLLAVIEHDEADGVIDGLDPSDFTVSDGKISSASVDTSGSLLIVIYATGDASES